MYCTDVVDCIVQNSCNVGFHHKMELWFRETILVTKSASRSLLVAVRLCNNLLFAESQQHQTPCICVSCFHTAGICPSHEVDLCKPASDSGPVHKCVYLSHRRSVSAVLVCRCDDHIHPNPHRHRVRGHQEEQSVISLHTKRQTGSRRRCGCS